MKGIRQLVRMDWGPIAEGHGRSGGGLKNGVIRIFRNENFHYHVLEWDK